MCVFVSGVCDCEYMCLCLCVYVFVFLCVFLCLGICICIYVCISVCLYALVCLCVCMCVSVNVYACLCVLPIIWGISGEECGSVGNTGKRGALGHPPRSGAARVQGWRVGGCFVVRAWSPRQAQTVGQIAVREAVPIA